MPDDQPALELSNKCFSHDRKWALGRGHIVRPDGVPGAPVFGLVNQTGATSGYVPVATATADSIVKLVIPSVPEPAASELLLGAARSTGAIDVLPPPTPIDLDPSIEIHQVGPFHATRLHVPTGKATISLRAHGGAPGEVEVDLSRFVPRDVVEFWSGVLTGAQASGEFFG
jgi:hypothetical protein